LLPLTLVPESIDLANNSLATLFQVRVDPLKMFRWAMSQYKVLHELIPVVWILQNWFCLNELSRFFM
jgi:hypothetical protein